jgi:DNA-binding transcriptional LysR family regulator
VDIGQLETFDRIVREGSFSRAAVALGIGQPAVSSRIQSLEQTLGLADRSGTATDLPMEVARHLILSGMGAGFFARTYVRTELAGGVLVEIPVRGMASLHRDVALVRRRGTSLSPAAAALVQALRAQAGRIGLAPKPPPKAALTPARAALGDGRR